MTVAGTTRASDASRTMKVTHISLGVGGHLPQLYETASKHDFALVGVRGGEGGHERRHAFSAFENSADAPPAYPSNSNAGRSKQSSSLRKMQPKTSCAKRVWVVRYVPLEPFAECSHGGQCSRNLPF